MSALIADAIYLHLMTSASIAEADVGCYMHLCCVIADAGQVHYRRALIGASWDVGYCCRCRLVLLSRVLVTPWISIGVEHIKGSRV